MRFTKTAELIAAIPTAGATDARTGTATSADAILGRSNARNNALQDIHDGGRDPMFLGCVLHGIATREIYPVLIVVGWQGAGYRGFSGRSDASLKRGLAAGTLLIIMGLRRRL